MKELKLLLAALFFFFGSTVSAQFDEDEEGPTDYTFQTDRNFYFVSEIFGYPFYPDSYEEKDGFGKNTVGVGEVKILLIQGYLQIDGVEGLNNFNVISINPKRFGDDFGFEAKLLDSRDPTISGTLKIITDNYGFVFLILFEAKGVGAYAFTIKDKPAYQVEIENKYFSRRGKTKANSLESLFGKTIMPFHWINGGQGESLMRKVSIQDSVYLRVKEDTIIVGSNGEREAFEVKNVSYFESNSTEDSPIATYIEVEVKPLNAKKKVAITLYFNRNDRLYRYDLGRESYFLKP